MTTVEPSVSAGHVLDEARRIAAGLAERAPQIEAARRLPSDLLGELVAAGCFRMLLPPTHGGVGASLPAALELYETLARADASTGWTVMIGATSWVDTAGLPRATFDALYPPSADVIVAGAIAPSGSIVPVGGAHELTGRWAFVSGCEHASIVVLNAIEGFADGRPLMRAAVLDVADVTIEDTWHVVGLRGTGSHHVSVTGAAVAPERTFVPIEEAPCIDAPILRIPTPTVFALAVASVAVGAARGALDDVTSLSERKVPLFATSTLAASALFQHDLAEADAHLEAARTSLAHNARTLWATAENGLEPSLEARARARAGAAWCTNAALAVTERAYRFGGGSVLFSESPLQRRLRDVHAITQHMIVRPDTFVAAGAALLGQPLPVPVF